MDTFLEEKFHRIEKKIIRVLSNYKGLKLHNDELIREKKQMKEMLLEKDQKIEELENKLKMIKIAENLPTGEEDKQQIKKKINTFVKEIDKCIAMLNA